MWQIEREETARQATAKEEDFKKNSTSLGTEVLDIRMVFHVSLLWKTRGGVLEKYLRYKATAVWCLCL